VIPKSQNPVVVISEPFVPDHISRAIRVLTTVGFKDEATLTANEIDRIRPDWLLSNKFESVQSP